MGEQDASRNAAYLALRCRGCGARFRARAWKEGMACPHCRGTEVRPLPAPGGAVDYIVADRAQGTTAADIMFAEWARWCGYITPNQYNTAVHRQNSELQSGQGARPIHEVMISLDFLDEPTASGLLQFLAQRRPDANDDGFAARLLKTRAVDVAAVEQVQGLQREMARKRNEVPPLAQLLLQKRLITEAQMLDLLQEQAKDGTGSLKAALDMSRAVPKEKVVEKLGRGVSASRMTLRNGAIVMGLALAVLAVWVWRLRGPQVTAYGQCSTCHAWVAAPWSATDWPALCPRCRVRSVQFAVMCPNGHVFLRASPYTHEHCPQCGADFGRPLRKDGFDRISQGAPAAQPAAEGPATAPPASGRPVTAPKAPAPKAPAAPMTPAAGRRISEPASARP